MITCDDSLRTDVDALDMVLRDFPITSVLPYGTDKIALRIVEQNPDYPSVLSEVLEKLQGALRMPGKALGASIISHEDRRDGRDIIFDRATFGQLAARTADEVLFKHAYDNVWNSIQDVHRGIDTGDKIDRASLDEFLTHLPRQPSGIHIRPGPFDVPEEVCFYFPHFIDGERAPLTEPLVQGFRNLSHAMGSGMLHIDGQIVSMHSCVRVPVALMKTMLEELHKHPEYWERFDDPPLPDVPKRPADTTTPLDPVERLLGTVSVGAYRTMCSALWQLAGVAPVQTVRETPAGSKSECACFYFPEDAFATVKTLATGLNRLKDERGIGGIYCSVGHGAPPIKEDKKPTVSGVRLTVDPVCLRGLTNTHAKLPKIVRRIIREEFDPSLKTARTDGIGDGGASITR